MAEQDLQEQGIHKFPRDRDRYELIAPLGSTDTSTTYKAKHGNVPVRIKIFDVNKIEDIFSLTVEIHESEACVHKNAVSVHCSFKSGDQLWVVMPSLSGLSLRSMIRASFHHGLPKRTVAFILKKTLGVLDRMHGKNKLHHSIDAGCIFLDDESREIKIALHSLSYEENYYKNEPSGGYPNWTLAPELMNRKVYGKAGDIWMFGLLALELFFGGIPASDFEEFQYLVSAIEDEFGPTKKKKGNNRRFFDLSRVNFSCLRGRGKKIPGPLGEVMGACVSRDPAKRPTTSQLMEFEFFQDRSGGEKSLGKLNKAWKDSCS